MGLGVRMWNEFRLCYSQVICLGIYGFPSSGLTDKMKIFEYTRLYQGSFQLKDYDKFVTIHKCTPGSLGIEFSQRLHSRRLSVFSSMA